MERSSSVPSKGSRTAAAEGRLHAELARFVQAHPRVGAAFHWILAHPMIAIVVLATMRGLLDGLGYQHPDDPRLFSDAATKMLSPNWSETFADERVQAGPLQLLFYAPVARIASLFDLDVRLPLAVLTTIAFTVLLVVVVRTFTIEVGRRSSRVELFAGLVAVLGGLSWAAATSGHPAEGFIPLLWLLAARDARHGRGARAGILLGLSAGFKLWGVMGWPLLLLSPRVRDALMGTVAQGLAIACFYGPFLMFGRVQMFDFSWEIRQHSPLRFLFGANVPFTWPMRVLQAAVIIAVGAVLSLHARRSSSAAWAVPLGIVAVRLLVDPLDYHYYWLPVGTIALVGITTIVRGGVSWTYAPIAAAYYVTLLPFFLLSGVWLAAWITGASLALIALTLRTSHGSTPAAPPEGLDPQSSPRLLPGSTV